MNRFAARGLLDEATAGKRIAVVGVNAVEARCAFRDLEDLLLEAELPCSVIRSNGHERITFPSGGSLVFWPARTAHERVRGHELDTLFVDAGADAIVGTSRYMEFQPALAARGGSIVRA